MAITPFNEADLIDRVADLRQSETLMSRLGQPNSTAALAILINYIAEVSADSGSGSSITGGDVSNAIDASLDIEAIKIALNALVTASTKRYEATILVDSTGTYYANRYDENAGTFSNINITTGLAYTPVPPLRQPDSNDAVLVSQAKYQVNQSTVATAFLAPGEELTKIVTRVNGTLITNWVNDSKGIEIPTVNAPTAAMVQPMADYTGEIIEAIRNKLDQLGNVYLDGQFAGTTYYIAIVNDTASQFVIGNLLSRRSVAQNGLATGSSIDYWYNETLGVTVNSPQPTITTDVIPWELRKQSDLINTLNSNAANASTVITTAPSFATPANAPTSKEIVPGTVALDIDNPAFSSILSSFGLPADAVAASDTGTSGLIGLFKRLLSKFQTGSQLLASAISIALPRKTTITGFLSLAAVNTNLLDPSGAGAATDVRDYNSGELTVVSTVAGGLYTIQTAIDPAFTIGVSTLQVLESTVQNTNPINAALVPNIGTRKFLVNFQGANYVRVNMTTGAAGVRPYLVLSQSPHFPNQVNPVQTLATSLQMTASIQAGQTLSTVTTVGTVAAAQLAPPALPIVDISSSVLSASTTTAGFTPTWGTSQVFTVNVSAITLSPLLDVVIQETANNGVSWQTVYAFERITSAGVYNSPLIAIAGRQYRYVQTLAGTGNVTRTLQRSQTNIQVTPGQQKTRLGGITSASDIFVGNKNIFKLNATNTSAAQLFVQFHNKAASLVTGDIPLPEIYSLAATNGFVHLFPSDFGQNGGFYGANTRLAISSTRFTYTAPATMVGTALNIEVQI